MEDTKTQTIKEIKRHADNALDCKTMDAMHLRKVLANIVNLAYAELTDGEMKLGGK